MIMETQEDNLGIDVYRAKKSDFINIAEIYSEGFSEPSDEGKIDIDSALKKIKLFSEYCEIWKIVYMDNFAGFIIINPSYGVPGKYCFIESMGIKKEFRGKSIGNEVLKEMMSLYAERGFIKIMGIANKDSRAFRLLEHLGIREDREEKVLSRELGG